MRTYALVIFIIVCVGVLRCVQLIISWFSGWGRVGRDGNNDEA